MTHGAAVNQIRLADCAFNEGNKKRSAPKANPTTSIPGNCKVPQDLLYKYVEDLEERVALLEKLIRRVSVALSVLADRMTSSLIRLGVTDSGH